MLESLLFVAQLRREGSQLLASGAKTSLQAQALDARSRQLQREEEEVEKNGLSHAESEAGSRDGESGGVTGAEGAGGASGCTAGASRAEAGDGDGSGGGGRGEAGGPAGQHGGVFRHEWGVESRCDVDVGQGGRKVRENMSPLQLFERSLSKKDPQFLKGGSYHFAVPNGQGKEWERVWGERKQRVEAMMRRFWDAWAYEGLLSAATRSSRGATTSCGRCRRVSRTARVAWR